MGLPRRFAPRNDNVDNLQRCYYFLQEDFMSVAVSLKGEYYRRVGIKGLSEPTYKQDIVEPLSRYSEKKTPLSRGYVPPGGWQDDFLETLVPIIGKQGPVPRDERAGTAVSRRGPTYDRGPSPTRADQNDGTRPRPTVPPNRHLPSTGIIRLHNE